MELMKQIWDKARNNKKTIVLPEGDEERTLVAAQKIVEEGLANICLVGNKEDIENKAAKLNVNLEGVEIID